jgi:hypothetical protein
LSITTGILKRFQVGVSEPDAFVLQRTAVSGINSESNDAQESQLVQPDGRQSGSRAVCREKEVFLAFIAALSPRWFSESTLNRAVISFEDFCNAHWSNRRPSYGWTSHASGCPYWQSTRNFSLAARWC